MMKQKNKGQLLVCLKPPEYLFFLLFLNEKLFLPD